MQYLDDDMDELFRKAAKDYPLKLQKDDWDAIAGKIAATHTASLVQKKRNSIKSAFRLLLLTVVVLAISGTTIFIFIKNHVKNTNPGITHSRNNEVMKEDPYPSNTKKYKKEIEYTNKITDLGLAGQPGTSQKSKPSKKEILLFSDARNKVLAVDEKSLSDFVITDLGIKERDSKVEITRKEFIMGENKMITGNVPDNSDLDENNINKRPSDNSGKKPDLANKAEKGKLYAGMATGPQFNQVKNQGFGKTGIYTGVFAGLQITNRMSVETGLFISEKKYFSAGEYFSMKMVASTMPAGMKIESLSGKSTVLEIPFKFKYDILNRHNGILFGTAGVSSYILTNESNNYQASLNGNYENLDGNYSRKNKYFSSSLYISAGYAYKAGKKITLRIEPYIQIPLRGIGVGSLPVLSTGINLGISVPVAR